MVVPAGMPARVCSTSALKAGSVTVRSWLRVDRDHVDRLVAERVLLLGQLAGGLGARVVEAALAQLVEDADAEDTGEDRREDAEGEHQTGSADEDL